MSGGCYAVVLAAGAASRFGGGKLTAEWRGQPLIRWSVRAALASDVEGVILVLGADAACIVEAVAHVSDSRLTVVEATDWAKGMSASLATGIRALPASATAVVIFLGDMPDVSPQIADALLAAVIGGAPAARASSPLGPAHPTAFAASAFPALLALTGDQGGRPVMEALGKAVAMIPTSDPGAVFDVDRPEDLMPG